MHGRAAIKADEVLIRTLRGENDPFDFLEIRPSGDGGTTRVPETMALLPEVRANDAVRTRTFELDMGLKHTITVICWSMKTTA